MKSVATTGAWQQQQATTASPTPGQQKQRSGGPGQPPAPDKATTVVQGSGHKQQVKRHDNQIKIQSNTSISTSMDNGHTTTTAAADPATTGRDSTEAAAAHPTTTTTATAAAAAAAGGLQSPLPISRRSSFLQPSLPH